MVRSCNQAVIFDDLLYAPANRAGVMNKFYSVPHFVIKCYMLYFYLASVCEHKRISCDAIILALGGSQSAPDDLGEQNF